MCPAKKPGFVWKRQPGSQKPRADGIIMSFRLYLQSSGRHDSKIRTAVNILFYYVTQPRGINSFLYAPVRGASFEVETTFWLD